MRIVVLGGGVVGVTTAYQLQKDGHDVVVLERNSEVAAEASWGNAGMIAPGHSFVWSSPKAPMILAEIAVSRTSGAALQALRRSAALRLVLAIPDGMHAGEGAPQHPAQAPSRRLFADRPQGGRRRRGDRLRSQRTRHPLFLPRPAGARPRRRAHEAARVRRPGDQGARSRRRGRARAVSGVGKEQDRRRDLLPDRRDRRIPPNSLERWRPRSLRAAARSTPARRSPGSRRTATASRRR